MTARVATGVAGPSAALACAAAVSAAMVELADLVRSTAAWSPGDRHDLLQRLDRALDGLTTVRATVLAAERESGAWQRAGDRSFAAWRARTGRTGQRSATAQVRQADQLATVPSTASAVSAGRIGLEQAELIARVAATGTPAQQRAASCHAGQEQLLRMAEDLDADAFAVSVARWAAAISPEALERDHEAQRAARFLHVTGTPRGTFVRGRLDSMAGHRLTLALEALTPRPAADDDRDPGQRRADALDAMAGRILALADTRPGGHVPPQVSMILTAETWAAARAHRDRRRRDRTVHTAPAPSHAPAPGGPPDAAGTETTERDGYEPATLEDGTPVPASELAAAMCDCEITRIVLDADGVPLDLGRTQRVFTREQRRAVIARDRECAWPECHLHARWAEVHHIRWWERDAGPTCVDNGVLLCSFHHHEVHRRDLTITRLGVPPPDGSPPVGEEGSGDGRRPGAASGSGRGHGRGHGSGRGRSAVAVATYRFRDPAGRVVGEPPGRAGHGGGPSGGTGGRAPGEGTNAQDLTWTTDPVTGMRVPTFLAAP